MKKYQKLYLALIIIVTCIVYSNHFYNAFHFDDSHTIENNLYIRSLKNIPLFFKDATTFSTLPANQAYRPVVTTSLAIDYWLGNGYNLFYFHLLTFVFYLIQGILMLLFFLKIFNIAYKNPWNYYISLVAVAWYLLHPAMAETVNYVIARSDIQSTFFVILAFVLYTYSSFCRKTFLYLLPIVLGTLAKPTAVMFAPILFFYVAFFEKNSSMADFFKRSCFKQTLNSIVRITPALVVCVLLYWWVDQFTPKTWQAGGNSPWLYLITQPFVITYYFGTLFLPVHLSADTDWQLLKNIWDIRFFIGLLFIILMLIVAFYSSKKTATRPVSFGIIWFFLALVPSSSIIPLGEVMNDHRMFFPFIGLIMAIVWGVALLLMKYKSFYERYSKAIVSVIVIILIAYGSGTYQRNKVWKTEESLWYDVTVKSPENYRGLMNYGLSKMTKGEYAIAEKYFTDALVGLPYYATLHINLGVLKEAMRDKTSAETYFKKALSYNSTSADSYYFYSRFLVNQFRYTEAVPLLLKAIEISPAYLASRELLMKIYDIQQEYEKLAQLAQSTLQLAPDNQEALRYKESASKKQNSLSLQLELIRQNPSPEKYLALSLSYYQAGQYQQSIDVASEALKLKSDYAEAYNNIGSAYNELKQFDKAIPFLKKAIALKPDFQLAQNNLALAENSINTSSTAQQVAKQPSAENFLTLSLMYFNQKKYKECIEACRKSLALKPDYDLAYNNICAAYNQLGDWENAIIAGEKGLKINPANELLKGNLAEAYKRKNK
ncbi:tetratricopeptide repeat protein [Emticicia sp. BO119]|uniref:tetratricopeptide repeat protein n=1 Tax=Emticicia sp. BO119 TaxID=2757768 RepID=UPI0015EFFE8F|nr:tetratricopeptide repeat protein [Emticicia sp. BO119]MBA4853027.1 tetratricopeptide repeat protein [Emticicia sp. BO119]